MRPDLDDIRDQHGEYPAYAWPGGYPMYYVTCDGDVLCPDCANKAKEDVKIWDIYFEGPDMVCDGCQDVEIEAAYGNPWEDDSDQ